MVQQLPEATAEHRPSWYQRALRWLAWLAFLAAAVLNSQQASFGPVELLVLAAAVAASIWCVAAPLGPPKLDLEEPEHLVGELGTRVNWALLLIGLFVTIGGIGGGGAIVHDLATGRASVGDVLHDIAIFVEGWFVEIFTKGAIDAELEKTRGYALVAMLVPGLILLAANVGPLVRRGTSYRILPDGAVDVRQDGAWARLRERDFETVRATGSTIRFAAPGGAGEIVLGQGRVFLTEHVARVPAELAAAFFRQRLEASDFTVEEGVAGTFTARR